MATSYGALEQSQMQLRGDGPERLQQLELQLAELQQINSALVNGNTALQADLEQV